MKTSPLPWKLLHAPKNWLIRRTQSLYKRVRQGIGLRLNFAGRGLLVTWKVSLITSPRHTGELITSVNKLVDKQPDRALRVIRLWMSQQEQDLQATVDRG